MSFREPSRDGGVEKLKLSLSDKTIAIFLSDPIGVLSNRPCQPIPPSAKPVRPGTR